MFYSVFMGTTDFQSPIDLSCIVFNANWLAFDTFEWVRNILLELMDGAANCTYLTFERVSNKRRKRLKLIQKQKIRREDNWCILHLSSNLPDIRQNKLGSCLWIESRCAEHILQVFKNCLSGRGCVGLLKWNFNFWLKSPWCQALYTRLLSGNQFSLLSSLGKLLFSYYRVTSHLGFWETGKKIYSLRPVVG